ncbi:hypothetical protein LJB82_00410 [Desulfovibrio sp. OttesenSCG-928-M16]|nr:hypothetical protein [Desulfovibrio sp. OttesenSCG-928-M16]
MSGKHLLFLFMLVFFLSVNAAQAANIDVMDRQRQQAPEPKSLPPVRISEDAATPGQDQSVRFTLGSLSVEGATVFTEAELLAPYRGKFGSPISFNDLNGIAAEMTKKYRDAGYLLSRVLLPAQDADPLMAQIRLIAVEGYIASVEYSGDTGFVSRFKDYFSSVEQKLLGKKPLKHKDFEREMLLLQDLAGVKISSHFKEAPVQGGSILVLEVERDLLDGSVGWGNTGTDSSGPSIYSASLGISTLPIGARTSVSYSQAEDIQEYYSIQVGQSYQFSNGLLASFSYAFSESQKPDSQFARFFDYETRSDTFSLGLSYPLIRSRDMNLSLGASYDHRNSYADLLDARYTSDRLRSLTVNANFDFADEWGGLTQIIPSVTQGLNIANATNKHTGSASPLAGAQYIRGNLYLSRNQQLFSNASLFVSGSGQISDSHQASYNRFMLGGSQFGRGYDPGVIEHDNGAAFSIEPRWTFYPTEKSAIQPFAFYDGGTVWASRELEGIKDQEHLSSAGLGIRFWGHLGDERLPDFNFSFFVGKPLEKVRNERTHERFVFQVALLF